MSSTSKLKPELSLEKLINLERIVCRADAASKKRSIELLSELISKNIPHLTGPEAFECLLNRERLGSTGVGHGVGLPHGRCKHISEAIGAMIQLEHGIDYDAMDKQPVDLIFALLVPEESTEEHLNILAKLAIIFKQPDIRNSLRDTEDNHKVFDILDHAWKES